MILIVGARPALGGTLALALALAGLGLGGCNEEHRYSYFAHNDKVTLGAGNAPAANVAIQTINPWPPSSQHVPIDQDGKRAHIAVKRYETNTSIPPRGLDSTNGFSGSNGTTAGPGIAR
jgi:hypothetical protein